MNIDQIIRRPETERQLYKLISDCPNFHNKSLYTTFYKTIYFLKVFSQTYTEPRFGIHRQPSFYYTIIFFCSLVSILGFIFNISVIIALLKHKALKNITNIYILFLASSDIIICSFNVPFQLYYEITETTDYTTVLCRVLFSSFGIPVYTSCFIILLIAIDRYQMIVYPLSRRIAPLTAILFVFGVLIFSVISTIPVAMYTKSKNIETNVYFEIVNPNKKYKSSSYCVETWPYSYQRLLFSISTFLLLFLIPLIITFGVYLHIYNFLNTKRVFIKRETERKKKTNKVLLLVVILFALCWCPWTIYSLISEVSIYRQPEKVPQQTWKIFICSRLFNVTAPLPNLNTDANSNNNSHNNSQFVYVILKLIAMGSAIVNPFLYGWLNEPIRLSMLKLLRPITKFCGNKTENIDASQTYSGLNRQRTFGLTIVKRSTRQPVEYSRSIESKLNQNGENDNLNEDPIKNIEDTNKNDSVVCNNHKNHFSSVKITLEPIVHSDSLYD